MSKHCCYKSLYYEIKPKKNKETNRKNSSKTKGNQT